MDMTMESCRTFVEVLASNAPAPGGGGAAAPVVAAVLSRWKELYSEEADVPAHDEALSLPALELEQYIPND